MKLEWPDVPVIMLSTHENAPFVKRALSDGAAGYLLKDATPEDLALAIDAAISGGGNVLSQRAIQALFEDSASSTRTSGRHAERSGYDLTPREHEILALLSEGRSNRSIAQNLYVSEETVKAHMAVDLPQARRHEPHAGRDDGRAARHGPPPPGAVADHASTVTSSLQPPGDATSGPPRAEPAAVRRHYVRT